MECGYGCLSKPGHPRRRLHPRTIKLTMPVEHILVSSADPHLRSIVRPSWSADGRTLYFCASDSVGWGVFAIRLDGQGLRPVIRKDDAVHIYECGVAAAGQFFLTAGEFDSDVHVMDLVLR